MSRGTRNDPGNIGVRKRICPRLDYRLAPAAFFGLNADRVGFTHRDVAIRFTLEPFDLVYDRTVRVFVIQIDFSDAVFHELLNDAFRTLK